MTTFAEIEQSQQDAQPIEMYEFIRGSTIWYYTNYPKDIAKGLVTWLARAITRSTITVASTLPRSTIELQLPFDDAMIAPVVQGTSSGRTSVTIYRGHLNGTASIALWKGRIARIARNQTVASVTCEPVFNTLQRRALSPQYQRRCIHQFGGEGCWVDVDALKVSAPVSTVSGRAVSVILISPPNLVGGQLSTVGGASSMIVAQNGSALTIMRPIGTIAPGDTVVLQPGCDRSLGTCATVHNNAGNFGGFPGIPLINPFSLVRSAF